MGRGGNDTFSARINLLKISLQKLLPLWISSLNEEKETVRPRDSAGRPGGILFLKKDIKTVILPDLHGRFNFLNKIISMEKQALLEGKCQVLCLGDALHGEGRAAERWKRAYGEYENGYIHHSAMDQEMEENISVLISLAKAKIKYREYFHYLKGNHDNVKNLTGEGNYSFYKYAQEGAMVKAYILKYLGKEVLELISLTEKEFPLFAAGRNFCASHSAPKKYYSEEEILNYRNNPDAVEGLTWTSENGYRKGCIQETLRYFTDNQYKEESVYLAGHRPVSGSYNLKEEGKLVYFHNPNIQQVAVLRTERGFNPETDIFSLAWP